MRSVLQAKIYSSSWPVVPIMLALQLPDNCVVYTGTHDDDTTVGWSNQISAQDRVAVQRYLGCTSFSRGMGYAPVGAQFCG